MARSKRNSSQLPHDGFRNRYMSFGPHRMTVKLDDEMWSALHEIARRERVTVTEVCLLVSFRKHGAVTLSRAVRTYIMRYFREAATEEGHSQAGHGLSL